jgi:hypothetical protein
MKISVISKTSWMELHKEGCGHLKFQDPWDVPMIVEYETAAEAKKDKEAKNENIVFKIGPCLKK